MTVPEDFEAFYAAAFGRLVGQVLLVTGDLHEAEDVVQEAFTRAAMRWQRLRDYDLPEAWVRRVALNLAASGLRQRRRRVRALLRLGPPRQLPAASAEAVAVTRALGALPVTQREVIVLHHLLDLPVDEVARQLAIPVGTVKSRLARGRRMLARRLGDGVEEGSVHHG